jgi:hypothetical protein
MKRSLVAAILGLAAVCSSYGQGHVLISNYVASPYSQVFWAPGTPGVGNQAVLGSQGVQLTLWYGEGVITDPSLLIQGPTFGILTSGGSEAYNPGAGHGPGGYYLAPDQTLATWTAGDTFTFQIRASGTVAQGVIDSANSRSPLWQENAAIAGSALPANANTFSAGLAVFVPEPSTFALAGLGSAALLIFRRRK